VGPFAQSTQNGALFCFEVIVVAKISFDRKIVLRNQDAAALVNSRPSSLTKSMLKRLGEPVLPESHPLVQRYVRKRPSLVGCDFVEVLKYKV
jgi:hypothetical protein